MVQFKNDLVYETHILCQSRHAIALSCATLECSKCNILSRQVGGYILVKEGDHLT